ncbi:unnamed protein product [Caenorhabditis bovis]|uniref:Uncharacterized protein n=1 Tax=Caenorhabditis bovis TaxID=2654633 RepID=A0A8S1EYX4_9PELO|nr:unnamed protein product [Caenorhabditis bovis]
MLIRVAFAITVAASLQTRLHYCVWVEEDTMISSLLVIPLIFAASYANELEFVEQTPDVTFVDEMKRSERPTRSMDGLDSPLIRFGKRAPTAPLIRFGRTPEASPFIRFGKRSPTAPLIRFGRAPEASPFIRFGKRAAGAPLIRFGRAAGAPLIRFGRSDGAPLIRFGRASGAPLIRFGRK